MDPNTGKIKRFQSWSAVKEEGYTIPLHHASNPDCSRCYGRGHKTQNKQRLTGRIT